MNCWTFWSLSNDDGNSIPNQSIHQEDDDAAEQVDLNKEQLQETFPNFEVHIPEVKYENNQLETANSKIPKSMKFQSKPNLFQK